MKLRGEHGEKITGEPVNIEMAATITHFSSY
jgi:hypothetical protein